jgi:ABC-type uncharacterized transport system fused permease/ATPase subunit
LYFQGKIDFGVINQSSSAFNHILSDVSLVVYQVCCCPADNYVIAAALPRHARYTPKSYPCRSTLAVLQLESLASFSAVIDRLGEFEEVINAPKAAQAVAAQPGSLNPATNGAANGTSDSTLALQAAMPTADSLQQPITAGDSAAVAQSEQIQIVDEPASAAGGRASSNGRDVLLELADVTLRTPDGSATLVQHLNVQVNCSLAWTDVCHVVHCMPSSAYAHR